MGCDSSESNFNNLVWDGNQWGYTSGWDYTVSAPTVELVGEKIKKSTTKFVVSYNAQRDIWVATPIDRVDTVQEERREARRIRNALQHLVDLKDGPRDRRYRETKDAAWDEAREALSVWSAP